MRKPKPSILLDLGEWLRPIGELLAVAAVLTVGGFGIMYAIKLIGLLAPIP